MYKDNFENGLAAWEVEQQEGGCVFIDQGKLVIADKGGCTVWFKQKLEAPVRISYSATVSSAERVSDLNCFWMANHPDEEDLFFEGHGREGAFAQYNVLELYYVGYGGNHNSTTRFRRYLGHGEKPLLDGYDLRDAEHLLEADHTYQIVLEADEEGARYFRDGELVFEYNANDPIMSGWFGFRTVWSRIEIDDFTLETLDSKGGNK